MHFTTAFAAASAIFAVGYAAPAPVNGTNSASAASSRGSGRPNWYSWWSRPESQAPACMSDEDATIIADTFRQLIQGYTIEMAEAALTEDFIDYSSAVSIIINKGGSLPNDVTKPIFTNRTQFMKGHGTQKSIPFETTHVWHNCNGTVSMRWITPRSGLGQPNESAAIPVVGTAILETEPAEENNPLDYNYRIHTLYSEFNTAAWLVNNGVLETDAPVTPVPVSKRSVDLEERGAIHEARDTLVSLGMVRQR